MRAFVFFLCKINYLTRAYTPWSTFLGGGGDFEALHTDSVIVRIQYIFRLRLGFGLGERSIVRGLGLGLSLCRRLCIIRFREEL